MKCTVDLTLLNAFLQNRSRTLGYGLNLYCVLVPIWQTGVSCLKIILHPKQCSVHCHYIIKLTRPSHILIVTCMMKSGYSASCR